MTDTSHLPAAGPTVEPPNPEGMSSVLERNIEALRAKRAEEDRRLSRQEKAAALITDFVGSIGFVYVQIVLMAVWLATGLGLVPGVRGFDRTLNGFGAVTAIEAILLSTFVLISQNKASVTADRRAELDLQINLLAEHEITHLIKLTAAIARRLNLEEGRNPDLHELSLDVAAEAVLEQIEHLESEPGAAADKALVLPDEDALAPA